MMHFRHMMFVGLASLIGVFAIFLADTSVFAQNTPGTMSGFAWSDAGDPSDQTNFPGGGAYGRGGGWISFDSDDFATLTPPWAPPSQTWSVTVNPNTGEMTGYAYSSFLGATHSGGMNPVIMGNASGYIRFQGAGDVTPDGFVPAVMARLDIQNGRLEGWARACAVFQSGCSGALLDPLARGGWDGWISLGGVAQNGQPYGVNMISYDPITGMAELYGYAWGDIDLGWIFFKGVMVQLNPNPPVYCTNVTGGPHYFIPQGYVIDPSDPTLCIKDTSVTFNPQINLYTKPSCIIPGQGAIIIAQGQDVDMSTCQFTSSPNVLDQSTFYSGSNDAMMNTNIIQSTDLNPDIIFYASCMSNDINDINSYTGQTVLSMCPAGGASVSLSASCTTDSNGTLNWNVSNAVGNCTMSPSISQVITNGPDSASVTASTSPTSYTLSCTGANGVMVSDSTIIVISPQCGPGPGGGIPRPGFQEI
ncbi:MAG: hypothetical protein K9M36_01080 [Candidatus Pacebacteria bacterium]|nr:hypothetical protein [Candidatus Paceibacterota bacterium]